MDNLIASYPPLVKEAWSWIQGWYNMSTEIPPPPYRIMLAHIMAERVELY